MTKNIGSLDRLTRAAIGIALIAWGLVGGPVWAWIGVVPLLTAGISFCPAYTLFGFRT
jgi:fatty acid desaturase